jgi:hypothetical protein
MTEEQKSALTVLLRQILAADLPGAVRSSMLDAIYDWPQIDRVDDDAFADSDAARAIEILECEIAAYEEKQNFCGICGAKHPHGFLVPDECWEFDVGAKFRFCCVGCYTELVQKTDGGAFEAQAHGKPATLRWFGAANNPESFPLPPGGFEELDKMSDAQREEFFAYARRSGLWAWLG